MKPKLQLGFFLNHFENSTFFLIACQDVFDEAAFTHFQTIRAY